ncbi:diacylglycerol/lipid kinase family protein [Edaphobacillus lindanitolerans]|uniref:Lipid kinase, YegS/Rv2252/BmrU family n=1 Tax=Edaphobacillus lindanitolerans TaxID=550447 RepID=A0A1U7PNC5_9BACI|nr:diacylglycerol kinase family protein [Edaphobacillus lindanitolerans]SIT85488.1 lipid kinase, YegS/Rv2252/BmrU family [Edaphobacillus lindanitolerans]
MDVIFIVNPAARNGRSLDRWESFCKQIGFPYEAVMTKGPGHAAAVARGLAAKADRGPLLLIAFGGDGTVHEVIRGAAGYPEVQIGSVGAGSGNDFGRGYLSFRTAEEIEAAGRKDSGSFDLGTAGMPGSSKPAVFVNSAGIGFDAVISMQVNRSRTKRLFNRFGAGKLIYTFFIVRTLFTFRPFSLTVDADGQRRKFDRVWLAAVSNQPYYGGGMMISPGSDPADGELELTVIHGLNRLKLLLVFGTVFTGSHTRFKEVHRQSGGAFRLTADRRMPVHTDGEGAGLAEPGRPIPFEVRRAAWRLAGPTRNRKVRDKHEGTP